MGKTWMELLQKKQQMDLVLNTNEVSAKYGLILSKESAELLVEERGKTLRQERRVEFGNSIIPQIIYTFCDSVYISQSNYSDILIRLQQIFYHYKNEMLDEITDEELLHFMKEQFETICYGDLDYLEGTCLENFAQAIRAGYQGHIESNGEGEYAKFDMVPRWDYDLYKQTLNELCGGGEYDI